MMKTLLAPAARLSLLLWLTVPSLALADPLGDLQAELAAVKASYETRITQLEERLARLEAANATAATAPDSTAGATAPQPPAPVAAGGGANAFNPSISLILAGNYAQTALDPASYKIAGFIPSGGDSGSGPRSFNLGESELTISANVDPFFFGNVTVAITGENVVSVEEAYFRTTALPSGFTLKGGRFFSGIGYLNDVHSHAWDFVDQPLAYQALLGGQRAQDGLQLKWLAPTDIFAEVGLEAGSGRAFPATSRSANGVNAATAFLHLGNDIGDSASWRAGISFLRADAEDRRYDDIDAAGVPVINAFSGRSQTWVADFTWKWAPHGNATERQLKLQGEYLSRLERGRLLFDVDARAIANNYRSRQSGWYLQGIYKFAPRWRVGLRYDALDSGSFPLGSIARGGTSGLAFPLLEAADPRRTTAMLDWNLSEFSRLRAQFAWDQARAAATDRQLQLQYIFSLGAHGAHKY